MNVKNADIFGRKVFFIAPNSSLIPLSFMEKFCTLGYESHILERGNGSLTENIATVTEHFPDAVLLFNIDADAPSPGWLTLIKQLRRQNEQLLIGVIFTADHRERIHDVETKYASDVSPQAGCIALSSGDESGNFKTIVAAMEKTGAKGRRNNIRAKCDSSSSVTFSTGGTVFHAKLDDINISHLCCILGENSTLDMKIYEKVRDAHICVDGFEFTSDIMLIMKRNKGGTATAIFMFIRKPNDEPGLENELEFSLNKKIYQITSKEFSALLRKSHLSN